MKKTIYTYIFVITLCALFGQIYTALGHGVVSYPMQYAFCIPLFFWGMLLFLLQKKFLKKRVAFNLYNAGVATFTVGSLFQWVLDISWADTKYTIFYMILWILLFFGAFVFGRWDN